MRSIPCIVGPGKPVKFSTWRCVFLRAFMPTLICFSPRSAEEVDPINNYRCTSYHDPCCQHCHPLILGLLCFARWDEEFLSITRHSRTILVSDSRGFTPLSACLYGAVVIIRRPGRKVVGELLTTMLTSAGPFFDQCLEFIAWKRAAHGAHAAARRPRCGGPAIQL